MVSMGHISLSCLGDKLKIQAYLLCPIETCAAYFGGCVGLRQSKMFLGSLHSRNHMLFHPKNKRVSFGPMFTFSIIRQQNLALPPPFFSCTGESQPSIKTGSNTNICRLRTKQHWR